LWFKEALQDITPNKKGTMQFFFILGIVAFLLAAVLKDTLGTLLFSVILIIIIKIVCHTKKNNKKNVDDKPVVKEEYHHETGKIVRKGNSVYITNEGYTPRSTSKNKPFKLK
jgi:hypothetical protein